VRNGCGYTVGELSSPIRFHRCFICSDSLVSEAEVFSNLAPSATTLLRTGQISPICTHVEWILFCGFLWG
jgi:hypothetical protein